MRATAASWSHPSSSDAVDSNRNTSPAAAARSMASTCCRARSAERRDLGGGGGLRAGRAWGWGQPAAEGQGGRGGGQAVRGVPCSCQRKPSRRLRRRLRAARGAQGFRQRTGCGAARGGLGGFNSCGGGGSGSHWSAGGQRAASVRHVRGRPDACMRPAAGAVHRDVGGRARAHCGRPAPHVCDVDPGGCAAAPFWRSGMAELAQPAAEDLGAARFRL